MNDKLSLSKDAYKKLYPHQQKAINKMGEYIEKHKKNDKLNGLISLPTGSGKTGIISVLARCYKGIKCVLIISPRIAITDQIFREVGGNFFDKLGIDSSQFPKKVVRLTSKTNLDDTAVSVFVGTIQFLQRMQKNKVNFEKLQNRIELVIFDEGHYEPALNWSKIVRSFKGPKVLFTATPFRNDSKSFLIDKETEYYESIKDLTDKGYLRKVTFLDSVKKEVSLVVKRIEHELNNRLGSTNYNNIIIVCNNSNTIQVIAKELYAKSISFIGIHENFYTTRQRKKKSGYGKYLYKNVPPLNDRNYNVWIHQYKLLEGIDNPKFKLLVIFDKLRNTRSFIQQVGRIIRKPKDDTENAYVIDCTREDYKDDWSYYENIITLCSDGERLNNLIKSKLPERIYWQGKFRDVFQEKKSLGKNIKKELQVQLKTNAFSVNKSRFEEEKFISCIEEELNKKDKIWEKVNYNDPLMKKNCINTYVYYFISISNGVYLSNTFYPEITHGLLIVRIYNDLLFYYCSDDFYPDGLYSNYGIRKLNADRLKSIFGDASSNTSILNRVNLKNANMTQNDVRSHSYSASSIEEATLFMNDFSHFMISSFGHYYDDDIFEKRGKRRFKTYIGISTGRIAQGNKAYTLTDYLKWLDYISKRLKVTKSILPVFNRFAESVIIKGTPIPTNVLFDYYEIKQNVINTSVDGKNELLLFLDESLHDKCYDIIMNNSIYSFFLTDEDNNKVKLTVEYVSEGQRFKLRMDDDHNNFLLEDSNIDAKKNYTSLLEIINRRQCFRLLTSDYLVYSYGEFFKPKLTYGKAYDVSNTHIEGVLHKISELGDIGSEKGTHFEDNLWERKSIFGLIARKGIDSDLESFMLDTKLLLCDDMQTECADFILLTGSKMIFIHAKGIGNTSKASASKYSAAKITYVCGQAVKNMHFLSMFDSAEPKHMNRWINEWKYPDGELGIPRLVINEFSPFEESKDIWNKIKEYKYNPIKEKEVWIVLGRTLDKDYFVNLLKSDNVPAEAIQATLIMENTIAGVNSMGARLRIFCN